MKVIIKAHSSVKLQATQFNPVEESSGFEIEMEVNDEEEAKEKFLKHQKWVREQNIKSALEGVKKIRKELESI